MWHCYCCCLVHTHLASSMVFSIPTLLCPLLIQYSTLPHNSLSLSLSLSLCLYRSVSLCVQTCPSGDYVQMVFVSGHVWMVFVSRRCLCPDVVCLRTCPGHVCLSRDIFVFASRQWLFSDGLAPAASSGFCLWKCPGGVCLQTVFVFMRYFCMTGTKWISDIFLFPSSLLFYAE